MPSKWRTAERKYGKLSFSYGWDPTHRDSCYGLAPNTAKDRTPSCGFMFYREYEHEWLVCLCLNTGIYVINVRVDDTGNDFFKTGGGVDMSTGFF